MMVTDEELCRGRTEAVDDGAVVAVVIVDVGVGTVVVVVVVVGPKVGKTVG